MRLEEAWARDGLEVAELVRDVGDAVGLEHQPRPQLRFGARELRVGDAPASATRSSSSSAAASSVGQRDALQSRSATRCRETAPRVGSSDRRHGRREAALDERVIQPRAALRRRRRESWTTGSRPWRRSAPRRAPAAERNPGRSPPARDTRPSGTPSCLRARCVTRRSPVCSGSTVERSRRRRLAGDAVRNAPPRAAAHRRCRRRRR